MKILVVTGIFPPQIGGPATYLFHLAKSLREEGHLIKIVTYGEKDKIDQDFRVTRVPKIFLPLRILLAVIIVFRHLLSTEVVYTHGGPFVSGLPVLIANLLIKKPLIAKITGDSAWEFAQEYYKISDGIDLFQQKKYNFLVETFRLFQKLCARKTKLIITPSNYLKKIVQNWGISENKIKVIKNSLPLDFDLYSSKTARSKLKIAEDQKIILSIGRLVPWKGFDTLIEIFSEISLNKPNDYLLIIIGHGPSMTGLKKLVSKLHLENKIIFKGKVDHGKIPIYLQAADIFVLNSSYEGLPHVILEAMQAGLPVITTSVCGNPEIVKNYQNGILVPYNDKQKLKKAITELINDTTLKEKIISNARKTISREFNWDNLVKKTLNVFKSAIQSRQ